LALPVIEIGVTLRDGTQCRLEGEVGMSVMEVIREGGLDELLALCGGCCCCATCHVYVDAEHAGLLPPMSLDEDDLLGSSEHRTGTSRLSCQLMVSAELKGLRLQIAPGD
jgi:ferredoxin, 2Fe-2S